jgi:hypothetical protein
MLTYFLNDKFAHVINLFNNGTKTTHIFKDHWISFQEFEDCGRNVSYIIAHDYGTGEKTFVSMSKEEMSTLRKEMNCDHDIGSTFKKALATYSMAFLS